MKQITFFFPAVFAVILAGVAHAADKPNIVLIMADDFGYECVTANGGESYETPHLDNLAATGMRFEHCYVQPVCTPTRVQLMTGLHNVRNYFVFGKIDPQATTFAHLLKKAGYATGIAGKWQLGREKDLPQKLGFDEAYLWQHTRRPPRYANPGLEHNGEELDFTNGEYGPDLINKFALDFITRHKDGPFLLYYPMLLTHSPFQPTPDSDNWNPTAIGEKVNDRPKHFADNVKYMDKLVGRIVAKLDELGIRDNTIVMFLGDNGTGRPITSQFQGKPYPGGKGLTNARGNHVPLIANWPGHVPQGAVNVDLISSTDFLPTMCEAADVELPTMPPDGQSFLPQLLGQKGKPREWHYQWYATGKDLGKRFESAMTKEYKLYRDGRFFDLTSDPYEEEPKHADSLSGKEAEVVKMLRGVLDQFADARPAAVEEATAAEAAAKLSQEQERPRRKNRRRARQDPVGS